MSQPVHDLRSGHRSAIRVLGLAAAVLCLVTILAPATAAEVSGEIDMQRAKALDRRERRGEILTPEEHDYVIRAKEFHQRRVRESHQRSGLARRQHVRDERAAARAGPVARGPTIGLVPLTQSPEGLYGAGGDTLPSARPAVVDGLLSKIAPLDRDGRPAANGRIVLLGVGMTAALEVFNGFRFLLKDSHRLPASVILVNGAQHEQDITVWGTRVDPAVWSTVDKYLQLSGATAAQVQAVWMLHGLNQPQQFGDAKQTRAVLLEDLAATVRALHARFANLRVIYCSSPVYGGWSQKRASSPEPYAHDNGVAIRELIARQMDGDPGLNFDQSRGEVTVPLLLWGPYLWADGERSRADGLSWLRRDFRADGTNFSGEGQLKAGELLVKFFLTHPTTAWFRGR